MSIRKKIAGNYDLSLIVSYPTVLISYPDYPKLNGSRLANVYGEIEFDIFDRATSQQAEQIR